ncbi:MAG TPA: prepilin-type N-terminal cleavage/methylation domain-containing protein [Vicinamibacterales bacterium]|nr:prepilin-type N-terminal cleavage/methylation domain-containing protein [Vicinamibacterales bacterium]
MPTSSRSASGFSLVETLVSILILTVGVLGLTQAFISGVQKSTSAPYEVLATQKAAEAIESVFAARDSHIVTWAELRNAAQGGVFLNSATAMTTAGTDGILNTSDDGPVETFVYPGPDGFIGTLDDKTLTLDNFTRKIEIVDLSGFLRQITVTVTYPANGQTKSYSVTSLISQYA